jgi:hypothetical protein
MRTREKAIARLSCHASEEGANGPPSTKKNGHRQGTLGSLQSRDMEMDFSHVVFPDVPLVDRSVQRRHEVARKLDAIEAALEREKRDLQREAHGCAPQEGVGVAVAVALVVEHGAAPAIIAGAKDEAMDIHPATVVDP